MMKCGLISKTAMYLSKPIYNMKRVNELFSTFGLLIYDLKQTLNVVVGGRGKTDSSRQIKKQPSCNLMFVLLLFFLGEMML